MQGERDFLREPNHGYTLNFRRRRWQQRKRMQPSFSQRRTAAMRSTSSCLIPWPVLEPASAMHDGQSAQQPLSILYLNGHVSMLMCIKASYVHTSDLQSKPWANNMA